MIIIKVKFLKTNSKFTKFKKFTKFTFVKATM